MNLYWILFYVNVVFYYCSSGYVHWAEYLVIVLCIHSVDGGVATVDKVSDKSSDDEEEEDHPKFTVYNFSSSYMFICRSIFV